MVTRRLLLLLFVFGCAVSMAASGRLVPRLIIDGAVSLAFVPIIEIAVFLALYRLRRFALPCRSAADRFLATNLPWLVWLVGVGALAAIAQPSQTNQWLSPIVWSAAVPILWSFVLEVRHYREDVGAEICHPSIFTEQGAQTRYEEFAARGHVAAIGSSDFHATGRIAMCRTFVFASEASAGAILDAIRARRTVVYGLNGKAYGDPALVRLAEADGRLRAMAPPDPPVTALDWSSRVFGILGLALLVTASAGSRRARRDASTAEPARSSA